MRIADFLIGKLEIVIILMLLLLKSHPESSTNTEKILLDHDLWKWREKKTICLMFEQ